MTGVVGESQQNPSKTPPTTIKINGEEPTANLNKQDKQAEASTDKPLKVRIREERMFRR